MTTQISIQLSRLIQAGIHQMTKFDDNSEKIFFENQSDFLAIWNTSFSAPITHWSIVAGAWLNSSSL